MALGEGRCLSPEPIVAGPDARLLGYLVTGVFAATYGGFLTAALGRCGPNCRDKWGSLLPLPPPGQAQGVEFNETTANGLPSLG